MALLLAAVTLGLSGIAQAGVIIDTDFDAATAGTYGAGVGDVATTVGGLAVVSDTTNGSIVTVTAGGDQALQFTDNNSASNAGPILSAPLAGISTDASGDNLIEVSFNYTRLDTAGANPIFIFAINQNGATSPGNPNRAAQIRVTANTGSLTYWEGTNPADGLTTASVVDTGFDLATGTEYVFNISLDLSSTTQDTYALSVATAAAPSTLLVDVDGISTTVDDITPDIAVFNGATNGGVAVASAFAEIDDISIESLPVPEPGSLARALGGVAVMMRSRPGRRD